MHDLPHQRFDHLVHGQEPRPGASNHLVRTCTEPLDERTRLHDQLAHLGQDAGQDLALVRLALGKEVMLLDRASNRLHLLEGSIEFTLP